MCSPSPALPQPLPLAKPSGKTKRYSVAQNSGTVPYPIFKIIHPLGRISKPGSCKARATHATKMVALERPRRDISVDSSLLACTFVAVEKTNFEVRSRVCVLISHHACEGVVRYACHNTTRRTPNLISRVNSPATFRNTRRYCRC